MPELTHLSPYSQQVPDTVQEGLARRKSRVIRIQTPPRPGPELGTIYVESPGAWLDRMTKADTPTHPEQALLSQHPPKSTDHPSHQHGRPPSACGSLTSGPTIETMSTSNGTDYHLIPEATGMTWLDFQSMPDIPYGAQSRLTEDPSIVFNKHLDPSEKLQPAPSLTEEHAPPMRRRNSETEARSQQSFVMQSMPMVPGVRSTSLSHSKSALPQSHRAKEALQREFGAGSKPLAQKPMASPKEREPDLSPGTKIMAKPSYQRPRRPEVMRTQCYEHPDGFRGEHELRRHVATRHTAAVNRWVCVDPNTRGTETDYKPHTPVRQAPLYPCSL